MAFRTGYEPHERYVTPVVGPTMTKQSFKEECDINVIMARYEKTGLVSHVVEHGGNYGDFTMNFDYHEAMNRVVKAREMFMTLPAGVRKRFDNDPGAFLDFVGNPANADEMVKLGLRNAPLPPAPAPAAPAPVAVAEPPPGGGTPA